MSKTPKQTARAFVAVDSRGAFAWGTVRPTPESCYAAMERHNHQLDGYPATFSIMPIQIAYDPSRRLVVQLGLELTPMERPEWIITKNGEWTVSET